MMKPPVLILHAPGTNRDGDLAHAISAAGGEPEIVPLSSFRKNTHDWKKYALLALPGGFSYGDALGAGRLWALDLRTWFSDFLNAFIEAGRPVIGICNGFQALVKSDKLLGGNTRATLTLNSSGHFECRWVHLSTNSGNPSPWLRDLTDIFCPVAHGEGRFFISNKDHFTQSQIAFCYVHWDGSAAKGVYPANPNGSIQDIAGITNSKGNVLGLMPHPENHIHPYQHPRWSRGEKGGLGIKLFENGLKMF
jgi:phosphoribosylformylglycinamidine synthase I